MNAGKIQNTLTVEVQRLFQTMKYYFEAAQAFVMLSTYIVFAFLANYQFAFLVVIGASASNFIYRKIYKATKKVSIELSGKGSDFNSFLTQTTTHFKYLKSTNTFSRYVPKLKKVIDQSEGLQRKIGNMNAITTSVKEPLIIVMVSIVILFQINWLGASLSTLILSLMLFYRALSYLVVVQNHWQGFIENIGGMNAVALMLDEMSDLKEKKGTQVFNGLKKGISFCNVDFYYGSRKILSNINLVIPRFATIALVGESGSGKSTIANLISALISPAKGEVLADDISLQKIDLDSYRNKIGYILTGNRHF